MLQIWEQDYSAYFNSLFGLL